LVYVLLGFAWIAGWVLGVIGFFSARSAHKELRQLRATLLPQALDQPMPKPLSTRASVPPVAPPTSLPPKPPPPISPPRDIEALLTTSWGVWLGSAALLFAGIFLVRYAVEQDLLGPAARCGLAALLGLVLLAAAEFLHRH
jgi:uncharacterized membrane protein